MKKNVKLLPGAMSGRFPGAIVDQDEAPGRELTDKQRALVAAFVSGPTAGNITKSAVVAGYSEASAAQVGCEALKLSHVALALDEALRQEIAGNLTAVSVAVMRSIITDPEAPLKLRGDLAARVVEFSGIAARVSVEKTRQTGLAADQGGGAKRLGEMTREELEGVCRAGAGILAAAAALPAPGQTIDQGAAGNREALTITQQPGTQEAKETKAFA